MAQPRRHRTRRTALLCAACFNDWFGIENKVPKADQVAVVNLTGSISYPSDDGRFDLIHVTDPQIIQQVIVNWYLDRKDKQDALKNEVEIN